MDLKNFDKQIKSSLENIEAPFDSSSWPALESRMNKGFSEEQPAAVEPVDLVVKRTLERLEAPSFTANWSMLNSRLNQNALVRRIKMSKLAEVAIFLLLLINIEGFLGGFKEVLNPTAPTKPKSNLPMAKANHHKSNKYRNNNGDAATTAGITSISEKVISLIVAPFDPSTILSPVVSLNDMASGAEDQQITVGKSLLDATNFYNNSGLVAFHKLVPLPHAKTPDFAWKNFYETLPGVITPSPRKANGMYATTFASFDKNEFKSPEYSTRNNGYGGGIAVGIRKGKWGIESGLAYSNKAFNPKKDINTYAGNPVDGFLGAYVKAVNADVFSVPVKVTHRIARVGKTSAHAVAGITANVATEKRFDYKINVTPPSSPGSTGNGPDPAQYPFPAKNSNGLLEGGTLRRNAYATADLGIRVERTLGKHYTAFIEPAYHRALDGSFGPKSEYINTFTFQAGVMAAL